MSSAIEINKSGIADGLWDKPQKIKLRRTYSLTSVIGDTWSGAFQESTRESNSSNIAPMLQSILDAKDRQDVFSAGSSAVNWLKSTEVKHRELYLSGFARELKKHAEDVNLVTPNTIVGLEVLTTFNSQRAMGGVLQEIVKRPISEEHLYLVGLAHDLNLEANEETSGVLSDEIAKLLRESLDEATPEPWQSHIVVEASRVLANWSPEHLVEEASELLVNVGELEMPAVLNAFLVAAAKQKDHADFAKWNDNAPKIWERYSTDTNLADAEGVLARLLSFDLLAGKSVADIIAKVDHLETSTATDTLYLLGVEGLKTDDRSQLVEFYKYLTGRLISEGQSKALSRTLSGVLRYDIQVDEILSVNQ